MMRRYLLLSLAVQTFMMVMMACCGFGAYFLLTAWLQAPKWTAVIVGVLMAIIGRITAVCTVNDYSETVLNLPQPTDELAAHDPAEAR